MPERGAQILIAEIRSKSTIISKWVNWLLFFVWYCLSFHLNLYLINFYYFVWGGCFKWELVEIDSVMTSVVGLLLLAEVLIHDIKTFGTCYAFPYLLNNCINYYFILQIDATSICNNILSRKYDVKQIYNIKKLQMDFSIKLQSCQFLSYSCMISETNLNCKNKYWIFEMYLRKMFSSI